MRTAIARLSGFNRAVLLGVSVLCLILAMVLVSADALLRKFGTPIDGAVPITELLISGLVFFGIVVAQASGLHLRVTVIDKALSPLGRLLCDLLGLLITFFVTLLIGWYGALQALDSWVSNEITESAVDIPVWPARLMLVLGCALLCLQVLLDAAQCLLSYPEAPDAEGEPPIRVLSE